MNVRNSDQTVPEILDEIEQHLEEEELPDDESLDVAEPLQRREGNAFNAVDVDSIEYVPTLTMVRKEAKIPDHVTVKDLVGKRIVVSRKWAQKAALPDTGELRDGFLCDIIDMDTRLPLTVWIGQVALMRDLTLLTLPLQTTITKRGRTYIFS